MDVVSSENHGDEKRSRENGVRSCVNHRYRLRLTSDEIEQQTEDAEKFHEQTNQDKEACERQAVFHHQDGFEQLFVSLQQCLVEISVHVFAKCFNQQVNLPATEYDEQIHQVRQGPVDELVVDLNEKISADSCSFVW
ncbi:hypothetical protein TNCT_605771 [Trichonephila clavata]|uniref:Uncharacterized protein n=1 Tax=Trichonephila clavata TaxID=2740835 RepID=A0A8X6L4P8_TRICU|nr:hypothetical protein TNCT_605771 [Trichonephila clavata]